MCKQNILKIDYKAIAYNALEIKKFTKKNIFAVVKNNAYNFGLLKVVGALISENINHFAVSCCFEAIKIKKAFEYAYVLQFNPADSNEIKEAFKNNIALSICSVSWLLQNVENLKNIELHLKVNVGMNRFGVSTLAEALDVVSICKKNNLNLVGLFTHFPLAEETDLKNHNLQVDFFCSIYKELNRIFEFKYIHSENTATTLYQDKRLLFCNFVRIGILLYGYSSISPVDFLKPTLFLSTKVIDIHTIDANSHLGYSTSFTSPKKMKVAVLPIGYGDGIMRTRKEAPVFINNKSYNIISKIFMSHMFLEVDDDIMVGDTVEIYGYNIKIDYLSYRGFTTNSEQTSNLHFFELTNEV